MKITAKFNGSALSGLNKEEIAREIEDLLQMGLETNVEVFNIMTDEECKKEEKEGWIETLTNKDFRHW